MDEKQHALFSPSSASIWLNCTYHLQLKQKFGDEINKKLPNQQYGTAMHDFATQLLTGKRTLADFENVIDRDDIKILEGIKNFVDERIKEYSCYYPEQTFRYNNFLFGTPDFVFTGNDGVINIVDFKFGEQKVKAAGNAQLLIYAFLVWKTMAEDCGKYIKTWIYQPRIDNIESYDVPIKTVKNLESTLKNLMDQVKRERYQYKIGDWCEMCRLRGYCQFYRTEFIDKFKMDKPYELSNIREIEETLDRLRKIENFAKQYRQAIISEIEHKRLFLTRYYKTNKKTYVIKDDCRDAVLESLTINGFDFYERREKSTAALKRELGDQLFGDLVAPYIETQIGAPFLRRKEIQDDE